MKICFDNINFSSSSGPNSFAHKLADQFSKMGHNITNKLEECDITLAFIEQTRKHHPSSKLFQRLDGIWFKPEEWQSGKNNNMRLTYKNANGVIFQSNFDKTMTEKWFGYPNRSTVIYNGIDLEHIKTINPSDVSDLKDYDLLFVCSSNWHPQKRLEDNIRLFQHIRKDCPKSYLLILGNIGYNLKVEKKELENVVYLGNLTEDQCLSIYKRADCFIHLAWLDHCPNVVVQSLSCGCPVICSSSGGTKEIVRNNGIILKEKIEYKFDLIDYDYPYKLDFSDFEYPSNRINVDFSHLDIIDVVKQYLEFFND